MRSDVREARSFEGLGHRQHAGIRASQDMRRRVEGTDRSCFVLRAREPWPSDHDGAGKGV
jgi:hypothetical protein